MRVDLWLATLLVACGNAGPNAADAGGTDAAPQEDAPQSADVSADVAPPPPGSLSAKYPGDVGMSGDPAVVWMESFEEGSIANVTKRYDAHQNDPGMALGADVPPKSSGSASMKLTSSGDGANATDLYKSFPAGYDEWYVRWYVKYQTGNVEWHHVGNWVGGYNPSTTYPNPQAGLKPNGDDRFAVSIEPVYDIGAGAARFDFYNYWMQMHSWMAQPSGNTAYYGNALVNQTSFTVDEGNWVCIEDHIKLNSDLASNTSAMLEVWKNDKLVQSFTETGPKGYWIRDKFCTPNADGTECTSYPAPFDTIMALQWRSTSSLKLTYFWPQNYITQAGVTGWIELDDMVIATTRIGCLQ